jgi:hypothetical protein
MEVGAQRAVRSSRALAHSERGVEFERVVEFFTQYTWHRWPHISCEILGPVQFQIH